MPSLVTSPLRCERGGKGGYYGKLQPVTRRITSPTACSLLSPTPTPGSLTSGAGFPPLLAVTSFLCPCVFLQQRFLRNVLPLKRDRGSSLSLSLAPSLSLARSLSLLAASGARNTTTTQPPPTPFPKHTHTEGTQPGEPDEPGRGWRESPASGLIAPVTFPEPLRERGGGKKKMNTERIPCLPSSSSSSAGLLFSLQNTKRWTGRSDASHRLAAGEGGRTNN